MRSLAGFEQEGTSPDQIFSFPSGPRLLALENHRIFGVAWVVPDGQRKVASVSANPFLC